MAHKTGLEDYYVIKNQKKLHFGYTTGSCAAGAAKGATEMLLGGQKQNETDLMTPKGILLHLELHDVCMEKDTVICAVRKDAGDDPERRMEFWSMPEWKNVRNPLRLRSMEGKVSEE